MAEDRSSLVTTDAPPRDISTEKTVALEHEEEPVAAASTAVSSLVRSAARERS